MLRNVYTKAHLAGSHRHANLRRVAPPAGRHGLPGSMHLCRNRRAELEQEWATCKCDCESLRIPSFPFSAGLLVVWIAVAVTGCDDVAPDRAGGGLSACPGHVCYARVFGHTDHPGECLTMEGAASERAGLLHWLSRRDAVGCMFVTHRLVQVLLPDQLRFRRATGTTPESK